ncbi:MAG: hypothetical protein LCH54_11290 [Bacteroidetes bacterium]|nr:hypothetical protein [Bacteroidota bacterium]
MKIKFILTLFLPILLFTGISCNSPTEPKDTPGPDTTSHNFVWRVDTIGTYLSLVRDVAIVDGNNIWAVGEFYKKHSTFDSTTKDQYNAAHWNGVRWELKRLPFDFGTYSEPFPFEINAVFVLNNSTVWGASGATPIRLGNEKWQAYSMAGISNNIIIKIWGLDDTHIWFVGNNGTILFFNGTTFTRIPYDESVDFIDVWGDETGVVRAVANNLNTPSPGNRSDIVELTTTGVKVLWSINFPDRTKPDQPDYVYSIWWDKTDGFWVGADDGIFRFQGGSSRKVFSSHEYNNGIAIELFRIKGNSENDWFAFGNTGQIAHYNGKSLWLYRETMQTEPYGEFMSLHVKGNVVCAGGERLGRSFPDEQNVGIVAIGRRY